ncbi:MAG: DUF502 domain-containing protein [Ignavibacteriaceae bacterium]|nr:DUF502 domain-containing protein [Ignavibacteriaceae bacterium]
MKKIFGFIKSMIVGGIIFFIPLIILIVIVQKAFQISAVLVGPIIKLLDITQIFGIGVEIVISIVIILFILYMGGLISKTSAAKKIVLKIENNLLSKVPGYEIIKKTGESFVGFETENSLPTVLARIEDAWQLAFLIEEIEGENYAVYIPGAPNPLSGSVYFLEKARIKKTTIPMRDAMKCLRGLGIGSNNLIKEYL